jgi:hypothetical protein
MRNAAERPLPDIVVLGAMRAGTTFMRRMLEQHPEICPSMKKEPHFFDYNFHRGERWYRSFYPLRQAGKALRYLDCTPCYLFHPLAPGRLESVLPEAKLLAILRDPVERAVSHYFHEVRRGREKLSLLDALEAEDERLAGEVARIEADDTYEGPAHRRFSYKKRGLYAEQLERWWPWIRSGRLMVVQSEVLFAEPHRIMAEIFAFFEIDAEHRNADVRARNIGQNRTEIDGAARAHLENFFRPHNAALENLLGRRFHWN